MAYDYPGSCAPSRWLPSAPKQKLERGPFGLAHRVPRASPMRAASGCLPPAVRIIPQYVPGLQPRIGACCQSRAIYYQQKRGFPRHENGLPRITSDSRLKRLMVARASTRGHWGHMGRWGRNGGAQYAGTFRVGSCPAKAGFVSDDATTPEGFGKSAAAGEAKPQARARRSCRISSQDDTAHRRFLLVIYCS